MLKKSPFTIALIFFSLLCKAQTTFTLNTPSKMVQDNIVRAANDFCPYETIDLTDRVAPEGYKPFFISFITRGGVKGEDRILLKESEEELSSIAHRIIHRFPTVWLDNGHFHSLAMPSLVNDAEIFVKALEKPSTAIDEIKLPEVEVSLPGADKTHRKMLLRNALFDKETALQMWAEDNRELFHSFCVSKENNGEFVSSKIQYFESINNELATSAERKLSGASLRFVDSATFQAILSIIGASGNDYVRTEKDCDKYYAGFISLCSSANFQIILYRNEKGHVIAKMLLNEREVGIPTIDSYNQKVYYDWDVLSKYFNDRLQGSFKKPALVQSIIYKRILKKDDTGLKIIGNIKAPEIGADKNPFWSIDCGTLDRDYADFSQYQPFLNELGAGYVRIQSGWQKTEQKKGEYSFEWLDKIVDGIIEEGLTPWMVLGYGNSNYCNSGTSLASEIFTDEDTMAGWCKYVEAVVKRYKGKIAAYEIWNEPNFGGTLRRAIPYANLFNRTAPIIRANDTNAKIAGLVLGAEMGLDFTGIVLDNLKETGNLKYLDILTFHPYTSYPEKKKSQIKALKEFAANYSPTIKLVAGESGYISDLYVRNQKESTELIQAKWVLRQMAMEFGLGNPTSIFSMVDNIYPDRMQSYGMIRTNLLKETVYKRPSFYSFRNLASMLNAGFHSNGDLKFTTKSDGKFCAVSICHQGKTVGLLIWRSQAAPDNNLQKDTIDVTFDDLFLSDVVYADPMTGRIYEYSSYKNTKKGFSVKQLPIWDSPIILIEKTAMK